ncbi:hypothetical protein Geu3261_0025_018 [Komagataeibacter europaeus NBRC 3261]|uniref:Uncharacterized protein n=1 Tax=Komagataeibacter europaeus NBRC 3261 TaxID=1234669 RepID=A0A0D6PVW2_KOMEU|nr:hypothetical protein [Komagataeibacter europaeus]GAN95462.1 hypothetical protein Geu3261_0025_018 [Komagataeibacter europaeus NBRC 3261]
MTLPLPTINPSEARDLQTAVLRRQECERQLRLALCTNPAPGIVLTHAERWRIRQCIALLTHAMDAEDIVTHQIGCHRVASHVPNKKDAAA